MSESDTIDELRQKLKENHTQMKSIDQLLLRRPKDGTLTKLKNDLQQVIDLTVNLINVKLAKGSSGKASNLARTESEEWRIGDTCNARWTDNRWYLARIEEIKKNEYYVCKFLEYKEEQVVARFNLRPHSYFTPRITDIESNTKCKALYKPDGLFYDATIKRIGNEGTVIVEFNDYNEEGQVELNDILIPRNLPIDSNNAEEKETTQKETDVLVESLEIPSYLKIDPTDDERTKESKRKRFRSLKRKHRLDYIDSVTRANQSSWKSFQSKQSLKRKSIFQNRSNEKKMTSNRKTPRLQSTSFSEHQKDGS